MNNTDKTEDELYDIIKNGINKDMSDDEVMRVIKYVLKNLPNYNKIKGTANAMEMVLKMFSMSCNIINLWHTANSTKTYGNFEEETAIDNFTDKYLTSRFNVEVYYSNMSFKEFSKNVALFVKLIDNVKPVTKILNKINFIISEEKDYYFYNYKNIIENELIANTIIFTDSDYGLDSRFKNIEDGIFIPCLDNTDNNVYGMLLNLVNAPYKSYKLKFSNNLKKNEIYIEVNGESKTINDVTSKAKKQEHISYLNNIGSYLSKTVNIDVSADDDPFIYETAETGIIIRASYNLSSSLLATVGTKIKNANYYITVIPTLTSIIKEIYNTNAVEVRSNIHANTTTVELKINHAKNTYSFGEV